METIIKKGDIVKTEYNTIGEVKTLNHNEACVFVYDTKDDGSLYESIDYCDKRKLTIANESEIEKFNCSKLKSINS